MSARAPRVARPRREVLVLERPEDLYEAAARELVRAVRSAVARRGAWHLALAGGATPRGLYARLAQEPFRDAVDWRRAHVFFGDERCVPPDHPDSNHAMALETLLSWVPLSRGAIHRIRGEAAPQRAAALYEREIRRIMEGATPRLDVVLLGMGADGHTASLFPGSPALEERARLAVAAESPKPPRARVTLTLRALNAARFVLFLVAGPEKADAAARVLEESPATPTRSLLPAARVRPARGRVLWLLDRAAASRLQRALIMPRPPSP